MAGAQASLLGRLLGTLFPGRCLGCGLRGVELCPACRSSVPWLTDDVCPICAAPTRLGRVCQRCRAEPPALDGSRAACRFEGVVRAAVHDLKYRSVRGRAGLLAGLAAEPLRRLPIAVDVLVPVPLASARRRQRGFNQAELIAQGIAEHLGWPVEPALLLRVRETPRQTERTASERRENVQGAFRCPEPASVAGRRVAVVDDVMTTGATLGACAEALKAAGAARVYAIVVAREV